MYSALAAGERQRTRKAAQLVSMCKLCLREGTCAKALRFARQHVEDDLLLHEPEVMGPSEPHVHLEVLQGGGRFLSTVVKHKVRVPFSVERRFSDRNARPAADEAPF